VPALIVQGRLDLVCRHAPLRAGAAAAARRAASSSGGHSATEPEIARALRRATDDMRTRLQS
jgi:hypothetical protein